MVTEPMRPAASDPRLQYMLPLAGLGERGPLVSDIQMAPNKPVPVLQRARKMTIAIRMFLVLYDCGQYPYVHE